MSMLIVTGAASSYSDAIADIVCSGISRFSTVQVAESHGNCAELLAASITGGIVQTMGRSESDGIGESVGIMAHVPE